MCARRETRDAAGPARPPGVRSRLPPLPSAQPALPEVRRSRDIAVGLRGGADTVTGLCNKKGANRLGPPLGGFIGFSYFIVISIALASAAVTVSG